MQHDEKGSDMKLLLTAAVALIALAFAGGATATPSLSYATLQAEVAETELINAKFKFKKLGHQRGFRRGHFGASRFGHRSFRSAKHGHFRKGGFAKKSHRGTIFFFGKGFFLK